VWRPEAGLLHLLLDLSAQLEDLGSLVERLALAPFGPQVCLVGQDVVVDDVGSAHADVVDPLVEGGDRLAVHGHTVNLRGRPCRLQGRTARRPDRSALGVSANVPLFASPGLAD
jgi:hypothetical protein